MKRTMWMSGLIAAGLVMLLTGSLHAQMMRGMGMRGACLMNAAGTATVNPLGLSADQLTQMQQMRLEQQKAMLPLRTQMQTKRMELQALFLNTNRNQSDVNRLNKDIVELQTSMQTKRLEHQAAMSGILTDQQKALVPAAGLMAGRGMGTCLLGGGGWSGNRAMGMGGGRGGRGRGMGGGRGMGPCGMGW